MKREHPIAVRFFLLTFVPVSVALTGGFWMFEKRVEDDVRQGLRQTLGDMERSQATLRLAAQRRQQLLVSTLAENATLKAGLTLWRTSTDQDEARRTIEDQLLEMGENLEADVIAITDLKNHAVAALVRRDQGLASLSGKELPLGHGSLLEIEGHVYEAMSVPLNLGDENLGQLVVGRQFDLRSFNRQAILMNGDRVISREGVDEKEARGIESGLAGCKSRECSVTLAGVSYLAVSSDSGLAGTPYSVWTLHSVESASRQLLGTAKQGLWVAIASMLIAALLSQYYGGRSVARPLVALVARLRESERSGVLEGGFPENSSTSEVNQLAHAFNMAALSVAESQKRLDEAYLQFTRTMAQTLDARDPYTAGHSSRVGEYAAAIAGALDLSTNEVESIRVGGNLHDIGKIGIPDDVLQKPGRLTAAEFDVIKKHPVIGKRILEGVARFRDYLAIVELHHENHDGSGYPWGLQGENVPLGARIVHVVDAFDAMTTNRPYRPALSPEQAISILRANAGTQFDPSVVEVFLRLAQADPGILPPIAGGLPKQLSALGESLSEKKDQYAENRAS